MPHVKVWIHAVWGTKNRFPYLQKDIRVKVFSHIIENSRRKDVYVDCVNGYTEHVHCLFRLNADMALSKAIQLLKGESSAWINKEKLTKTKFEWADEYFAASVGEAGLIEMRKYIWNQEAHHKERSFDEEYQEFLRKYGFDDPG